MGRALASEPEAARARPPDRRASTSPPRRRCSASSSGARRTARRVLLVSDELDELAVCDRVLVDLQGQDRGRVRRRLAATRTSSPRSRGSDDGVTETVGVERRAGAARRPAARGGPRRFRLRELTLVPAIVLAIVAGTLRQRRLPDHGQFLNILQQSSELSRPGDRRVADPDRRQVRPVAGVDRRARADARRLADASSTTFGGSGFGCDRLRRHLPIVFVVGALVGVVNGFLIVRLRLNAFIVTLAMLILLRGVTLGLDQRQDALRPAATRSSTSARANWLGVPVSIWIAGARSSSSSACSCATTGIGRALYAIGGNAEAARAAGIRVDRVTWGRLRRRPAARRARRADAHRAARLGRRRARARHDLLRLRRGGDRRHQPRTAAAGTCSAR